MSPPRTPTSGGPTIGSRGPGVGPSEVATGRAARPGSLSRSIAVVTITAASDLVPGVGRPDPGPDDLGDGTRPATQGGHVVVQVAGAVTRPGVVELPTGSRVIDAVDAVGGALPSADLDHLNLAAKLRDGEQVLVPVGTATTTTTTTTATTSPGSVAPPATG